jgi:cysteine desulfurase/selenocysteine lyase
MGEIDLDCLTSLLGPRTRVVAFNHVSNALGTINPVREIAALVRERCDAILVCDGAQSAPHFPVRFDALGVDFYAFSGHKMLGPMGIGGLIGRRALLERMGPYQTGGDMIEYVMDDRTTWNVLPHKFEAGTPNVAGAVGLAAAVDYLERLGMERVAEHERMILVTAIDSLTRLDGVRLLGPPLSRRSGVVSFVVDDIHPHDLATVLDGFGVCVRAGHHCAQPLMRRLGVPATTRASFYVYTGASDVERLAEGIVRAQGMFATPTAPPR